MSLLSGLRLQISEHTLPVFVCSMVHSGTTYLPFMLLMGQEEHIVDHAKHLWIVLH